MALAPVPVGHFQRRGIIALLFTIAAAAFVFTQPVWLIDKVPLEWCAALGAADGLLMMLPMLIAILLR